MTDLPERGELVIAECTKIMNYGAFFDLIEYDGLEGFVHISQVASGRVKNIYNYLKRGQLYVARVTRIDRAKNETLAKTFHKIVSSGAKYGISFPPQLILLAK